MKLTVATSDGGISLGLQVTIITDAGDLAKSVASQLDLSGVGSIANGPLSSDWVAVEESRGSLEEDGGGVVEMVGIPETRHDALSGRNTGSW